MERFDRTEWTVRCGAALALVALAPAGVAAQTSLNSGGGLGGVRSAPSGLGSSSAAGASGSGTASGAGSAGRTGGASGPGSVGGSSSSSGSGGSDGSTPSADPDAEALRTLAAYRLEYGRTRAEGDSMVSGTLRLDDGRARRVVGVRVEWAAPVARIVLVAPADGTLLEVIVDVDAEVAHLIGVESGEGTLRTPETLTECFRRSDADRITLDCDTEGHALELDVRVLSAVAAAELTPRQRGWASAATAAVLGNEVWDTRARPTWVSRDGTRARLAIRTETWPTPADPNVVLDRMDPRAWASRLVDGEVEVTLGTALGDGSVSGEPTVSSTAALDCGPPYMGCCMPPPRVCSIGPTISR